MFSTSNKIILFCLLFLLACGKKQEVETPPVPRSDDLKVLYEQKLKLAKDMAYDNGWLELGCDAMLFAGKYACSGGEPNILAAEYPDQLGRFNRKPLPGCGPDFGNSKTTWSRDMGMGLLAYGWCKKDLPTLERHAKYGEKKNWVMGSPLADGRVIYVPSTIGALYSVIWGIGGQDNAQRLFPQLYPAGLDDYQAHLQMMNIWLFGEINQASSALQILDISKDMFARVKEHSDREKECPFYLYLRGIYDGDMKPAVDSLLASDKIKCEYMRSSAENRMDLGEWLFAAKMTLKKLGLE